MSMVRGFDTLLQTMAITFTMLFSLVLTLFAVPRNCPAVNIAVPEQKAATEAAGTTSPPTAKGPKYKESELLVKFRKSVPPDQREKVHKTKKAEKIGEFADLDINHVRLSSEIDVQQAILDYLSAPEVEYAEPNYRVRYLESQRIPDDPLFGYLWGLHNIGQTGGMAGADLGMPAAWQFVTGSNEVAVAVIDTGIDYRHEDLSPNVWLNPMEVPGNLIDDDGNGYVDDLHGINAVSATGDPMDDSGHGTHVAGTIGAAGNNRVGIAGVNWDVKVIGCKFLNRDGNGYLSDALECLEYIRKLKGNGVDIVATNNSWGAEGYSQALMDGIRLHMNSGILFVAAAGNTASDNDRSGFYPAGYRLPNVIAVAATDQYGQKADFSNYGKRSVHVGAPGAGILSLRASGTDMNSDGSRWVPAGDPSARYLYGTGTSMSAPHVTGLAALVRSADRGRDWRTIKNLLLTGGVSTPSLEGVTISAKTVHAGGALACVDAPLFRILDYPTDFSTGSPETVSALSVNCGQPVGPVTLSTAQAELVPLRDDGNPPDLAADDGIFSGLWVPAGESDILTVASPLGTESTGRLPWLKVFSDYLSNGKAGSWFSNELRALGGIPPYFWSVVDGALPPGLSMAGETGVISGMPTLDGRFNFVAQVTDGESHTATGSLSIVIGNSSADDMVYKAWSRMDQFEGIATKSRDIAVDGEGNSFIIGYSSRNFIIKIRPDGSRDWTRTLTGNAYGVTTDQAGAVFVAGATGTDCFITKYDSAGNELWTRIYDGGAAETLKSVALDGKGNLYAAGTGNNFYLLLKYECDGDLVWARNCGPGSASAVSADSSGNAYVTGGAAGRSRTVKCGPDSSIIWERFYDGGGTTTAQDIAGDATGNVYVTGYVRNGTVSTWVTIKYDGNGTMLWCARLEGSSPVHCAYSIAVDPGGNAYVVGNTGNLSAGQMVMYDANGAIIWKRRTSSLEDERGANFTPYAVACSERGEIHITGYGPYDSGCTISRYRQHFAIVPQQLPSAYLMISPYASQLTAVGGSPPYAWSIIGNSLPPGFALDGATGEISGNPAEAGTWHLTVRVTDRNNDATTRGLTMQVSKPPLITVSTSDGGTVVPSGVVPVVPGSDRTFAITPSVGHHIMEVLADGVPVGAVSSHTFTNVTADHTLSVLFAGNSYVITASAEANGRIAPSGTTYVDYGDDLTYEVTPDAGYAIREVLVDGLTAESGGYGSGTWYYRFTAVTADHSISASFMESLRISTEILDDCYLRSFCSRSLTAGGGSPPYTWVVAAGALPPGLSLNGSGEVSGTPSGTGSSTFTAGVADAVGRTALREFTLTIGQARPDLVAAGVMLTKELVKDRVHVAGTVRNEGGAASGRFKVAFHLSDDDTITTDDPKIGERTIDDLCRGGSVTVQGSFVVPLPGYRSGRIGIIADTADAVTETDETNNAALHILPEMQ